MIQITNNLLLLLYYIRTTDLLQKLDQTEFAMLEKIPDIFSWKRFNNTMSGRDPRFNIYRDDDQDEKSIDEYVCSLNRYQFLQI